MIGFFGIRGWRISARVVEGDVEAELGKFVVAVWSTSGVV
jgi:hypothetical protein